MRPADLAMHAAESTYRRQWSILRPLYDRGASAVDPYILIHEGAHAIDLGLRLWSPASVDRALSKRTPSERLDAEALAHAAARIVCAEVGLLAWSPDYAGAEVRRRADGQRGLRWTGADLARRIRNAAAWSWASKVAGDILALAGAP